MLLLLGNLVLILILQHAHGFVKKIQVDNDQGVDDHNCLNGTHPCQSLQYVFDMTMESRNNLNDTDVSLSKGIHHLLNTTYLEFVYNFKLVSTESAIMSCNSFADVGLHLKFSVNITIQGLEMQRCGHTDNHLTASTGVSAHIAIYFQSCVNIKIVDSKFYRNVGVAVAMVDVLGYTEILNTSFIGNSDDLLGKRDVFGGGIYIELSGYKWKPSVDTRYVISGCKFYHNSAEGSYDAVFPKIRHEKNDTYFGKGAGINIHVINSQKHDMSISHCEFSHNYALWGAAIFASFIGRSDNNSLSIKYSNFSNNNATIGGGAIKLIREVHGEDVKTSGNEIEFLWLNFIGNRAIWGGAMSISLVTDTRYRVETENRNVDISNCKFINNRATVGFAVGLDTLDKSRYAVGAAVYQVNIEESLFEENCMLLTEDEIVIGQGAIYAEEVSLIMKGRNSFLRNFHTAVCLDSSKLTFKKSSRTIFDSNSGNEGGAISLYGYSWILLEKNCNVTFWKNTAHRKGGAIFVRNPGPPRVAFQTTELQIASCFLRYEKYDMDPNTWPITINFQYNTAPIASGNSIYATTLKYCRRSGERRNESSAFTWKPIKYENNVNSSYEVVTDAIKLEVRNLDKWNASPNLLFDADVNILDEKDQMVYGTIQLDIEGANLDPPNNVFLARRHIKKLKLLKKEQNSDNFNFSISTETGTAIKSKTYNAAFNQCKPGFALDEETGTKCMCMSGDTTGVLRCLDNGTVYIIKGRWGYIDKKTGLLETMDCPEHYCDCLDEVDDYICRFDEHRQCKENRHGILCSQCPRGESVHFGNEVCAKCTNLSLLYLIPIFLSLAIISGIIFRLNIDVFSGHLNAGLYCYQMIMLLIPESIRLDDFINIFIGFVSLGGTGGRLGFCLYDGLNNLDKLFINYIPATFVVFCTLAFGLWIPQKVWERLFCCCVANREGEGAAQRSRNISFGRALSFVLVLCYSSFTTVTLKLLHPVPYNGKLHLYDAGFQEFLHGRHLIYFIVALLVLIFIVIGFPILLLFTHKFSERFSTFLYLQPIFDALKQNFRDPWWARSFAAFYFLCRLILLIINIFFRNELTRLIVLAIASVIIQSIFSSCQPYKSKEFNYWDIIQLSDMCLISLLSLVLCVPYVTTLTVREHLKVFIKVLVYVPLITGIIRLAKICYTYFKTQEPEVDVNNDDRDQSRQLFGRLGTFGNRVKDTGKGVYEKLLDKGPRDDAYVGIAVPHRVTRDLDD